MWFSLNPFFGSTPLLLVSSAYPTLVLKDMNGLPSYHLKLYLRQDIICFQSVRTPVSFDTPVFPNKSQISSFSN